MTVPTLKRGTTGSWISIGRGPTPAVAARVHVRTLATTAVTLLFVTAVCVTALCLPGAGITAVEAFKALIGADDGFAVTVVMNWRAPRATAAIVAGAALGVAGLLFQTLTRNPLGSPDIIGFNTGAYTGVLIALLAGASGFGATAVGALVGGCATAATVAVLSAGRAMDGKSHIGGTRLILVGLGTSMMLAAFNRWLILRGDMNTALSAASWGAGTLNGLRWEQTAPACTALVLLLLVAAPMGKGADLLRLGDDAAGSLGLPVPRTKALLLATGASLTAVSTAIVGPISFVALAAPHIAARITRCPAPPLAASAATGALLLLVADVLALRLFHPVQLPAGLVTVTIGGAYLLFVLSRRGAR